MPNKQRIGPLGKIGLNSDIAPSELPIECWNRAQNIRCIDDSIGSVLGEVKLFNLPRKPLYHFVYLNPQGVYYIVISDGVRVDVIDMEGTSIEITPASGVWTNGVVSFTVLNGVLVVNSASDGPFYWPGGTADLVALPGWDSSWRCQWMSSYRYYLVALNMTEGASLFPHKGRWSNSAEPGAIPTQWVASLSNDAGDFIIGDTPGAITTATVIRDQLWIVKSDAIYTLQWIGGQYVFQTVRLQGATGSSLARAIQEIRGSLAILTTDDLLLVDGVNTKSLSRNKVNNIITDTFSQEYWDKAQLFAHEPSNTLYVCGVNKDEGNNRLTDAFVWDWTNDTWGHRVLRNSYGFDVAQVSPDTSNESWDTGSETWDSENIETWNRGVLVTTVRQLLTYQSNDEDTSWWVSIIADTGSDFEQQPIISSVERESVPIEGTDGIATVTAAWIEAEHDQPILIEFGSQNNIKTDITWLPPYTLEKGHRGWIPMRISGRYISWRISNLESGNWRVNSITIEWQKAGQR